MARKPASGAGVPSAPGAPAGRGHDDRGRRAMADATSIESMMQELRVVDPPEWVRERAYIKTQDEYEAMYKRSVEDPEGFWAEMAEEHLYWHKKWDSVLDYEFDTPRVAWFSGGKTNVAYNLSLIHISEPTRLGMISYAVFCLKKKKKNMTDT